MSDKTYVNQGRLFTHSQSIIISRQIYQGFDAKNRGGRAENPVKCRVEVEELITRVGQGGLIFTSWIGSLFFANSTRMAMQNSARMAKLVDAPGLGPDASNGVGVRVPLLAPRDIYFFG
jgi:hypothetical protein